LSGLLCDNHRTEHGQTKLADSSSPAAALLKSQREKAKDTMTSLMIQILSSTDANEAAQGLVEYALIIALMCFAAVVAMQTIATDLNNAFSGISKILNTYVP
jgi:Flp pilus assembly pilin Flp